MQTHRFFGDGVSNPQFVPGGVASACAFMVCPWGLRACWGALEGSVEGIYDLAYRQAREALLPPRHERSLLASLN